MPVYYCIELPRGGRGGTDSLAIGSGCVEELGCCHVVHVMWKFANQVSTLVTSLSLPALRAPPSFPPLGVLQGL